MPVSAEATVLNFLAWNRDPGVYRGERGVACDSIRDGKILRLSVIFTDVTTNAYVYPLPLSHEIGGDYAKRALPVINYRQLAQTDVRAGHGILGGN